MIVGAVLLMSIWVNVVEAALPAVSVQVPAADWSVPLVVTVTGAVRLALPAEKTRAGNA